MRVYGVTPVATSQTLNQTVFNLKSNTKYIFKYFCVNQMGVISDGQTRIFNSLNYGAYLMKVNVVFEGKLNYKQYNDIACSMAHNFVVPYERVMTEAMSICKGPITPFYSTIYEEIANEPSEGNLYSYNFYILPNYKYPFDRVNNKIRAMLSIGATPTTVISLSEDFISLPMYTQMVAQDIQYYE